MTNGEKPKSEEELKKKGIKPEEMLTPEQKLEKEKGKEIKEDLWRLKHENPAVRKLAAWDISKVIKSFKEDSTKETYTKKFLMPMLEDEGYGVKRSVIEDLGGVIASFKEDSTKETYIKELLPSLKDGNENITKAAIGGVGEVIKSFKEDSTRGAYFEKFLETLNEGSRELCLIRRSVAREEIYRRTSEKVAEIVESLKDEKLKEKYQKIYKYKDKKLKEEISEYRRNIVKG